MGYGAKACVEVQDSLNGYDEVRGAASRRADNIDRQDNSVLWAHPMRSLPKLSVLIT